MSTAKQVREELCRATGQQVWSNNQYWSFYLANTLPVAPVYLLQTDHRMANIFSFRRVEGPPRDLRLYLRRDPR